MDSDHISIDLATYPKGIIRLWQWRDYYTEKGAT